MIMMNKKEFTCALCGAKCEGFGNNPEPLAKNEERCCDDCNIKFVIPARMCAISINGEERLKEIKKEVKECLEKVKNSQK